MARPLRIEYPDACYHIMNRGNLRATVFHNDSHYQLFIDKLGEFSAIYRVSIRCYCCLPNHFHLYIQTSQPNLSRFMQGLLTSFTVIMNRWQKSSGHLFQGRFKAHVVEDKLYCSKLSRYIHLNPVRVAGMHDQDVAIRRNYLRGYRWSSYPHYLGTRPSPDWLDRSAVFSTWGATLTEQVKNYRRYVEEGLLREIENPFDAVRAQTIIGTDDFVDQIKCGHVVDRDWGKSGRREQRAAVQLEGSFTLAEVVSAVARVYEVKPSALAARKATCREGRRLLLYCVGTYCRSGESLSALGRQLSVSVSGLTRARDRMRKQLEEDDKLSRRLKRIIANLRSSKALQKLSIA